MLKTIPQLVAEARLTTQAISAKEALPKCIQCEGILIDVREPAEYAQKSVANAINIPRGVLEMQIVNLCPKANTALFIHCATGGRATLAAEQLHRIGYTNVTVISCKLDDVYSVQESLL